MNLVAGATGVLGSMIVERLATAGLPTRALVRSSSDPERVARLRAGATETVTGDLKDAASLAAACASVRTVISTANTITSAQQGDSIESVDRNGQLALVDAAQAAGAEHFIFVSFTGNVQIDSPFTAAKRAVEMHVMRSGMHWTILRPSLFMEVWLSPALGFDYVNGRVQVLGTGENGISYVSVVDVAAYAVACVDNPASHDRIIEIGGPEAIPPLRAVRMAEERLGRPLDIQHVPEEALRSQYEQAADPLQKSFAALMMGAAGGDAIEMEGTAREFGVQPRSVGDYLSTIPDL